MKILVTGASGFIGYKLASDLADSGHEVVALCNKNSAPRGCTSIIADLADRVPDIPNGRYDITYHLAAATPLARSSDGCRGINYGGVKNILDAVKGRTDFFVYVTGTGIYGKTDSPITSETKPNPHTKYSKVRLEAQNYAQSACSKDNSAFAVACMGDVYGAGGWLASQIVPRIKKNRFKVPGDGTYKKSFVHIDDAVTALGAIGMHSKEGIHILADSDPVMFSEFIRYICKLLDHKYPGNIPSMIATMMMGQDAVRMLTTPTVCDGSAMAKMINVRYPSYKTGLVEAIGGIIS